jgi:hypothetical protein
MADEPAQIRIVGARELTAAMRAAGEDLNDIKAANIEAASIVLAAADPPRRSGRLAASGRAGRARARARVTYSVPYAQPIHWGWPRRGIAANPWLSRAAQATEPTWTATYLDAVNQIIDRVNGAT